MLLVMISQIGSLMLPMSHLYGQTKESGVLPVPQPKSWSINTRTCPLKLTTYGNGFDLRNTSERRIAGYRLACALRAKGAFSIRHLFPAVAIQIDSGSTITSGTLDSIVDEKLECVQKRRASLVVTQVEFEDGSTWALP